MSENDDRPGLVPWQVTRARLTGLKAAEDAVRELRAARDAVRALRGVHVGVQGRHPMIPALGESEWCSGCGATWPCRAIRVLDGAYEGPAPAERGHVTGCRCNEPYPCGREGESEGERDE